MINIFIHICTKENIIFMVVSKTTPPIQRLFLEIPESLKSSKHAKSSLKQTNTTTTLKHECFET